MLDEGVVSLARPSPKALPKRRTSSAKTGGLRISVAKKDFRIVSIELVNGGSLMWWWSCRSGARGGRIGLRPLRSLKTLRSLRTLMILGRRQDGGCPSHAMPRLAMRLAIVAS